MTEMSLRDRTVLELVRDTWLLKVFYGPFRLDARHRFTDFVLPGIYESFGRLDPSTEQYGSNKEVRFEYRDIQLIVVARHVVVKRKLSSFSSILRRVDNSRVVDARFLFSAQFRVERDGRSKVRHRGPTGEFQLSRACSEDTFVRSSVAKGRSRFIPVPLFSLRQTVENSWQEGNPVKLVRTRRKGVPSVRGTNDQRDERKRKIMRTWRTEKEGKARRKDAESRVSAWLFSELGRAIKAARKTKLRYEPREMPVSSSGSF